MDQQRIPLVAPIGARYESLTVDAKLVNCFAEQGMSQGQFHVYKRPGFARSYDGSPGTGRGMFTWLGSVYKVQDGALYKDNSSLGAVSNSGSYAFTATTGKGITPVLFATNGVAAYTVSTTGTITDVTAAIVATIGAATWIADCVFLDAYVNIFDTEGTIWTSDAGDATTWPALNYVSAWLESDAPVALHKHLSYILAIKEYYTQVFYDAGNAVGSPLSPVPGAKINFGCIHGRTVAECGGDVMWVARTREGGITVILVSALKAMPVSTPPVERLLQAADYSGNVYSWSAKVDGHRFYGVTVVNSNLTLVYDITSRLWYQWTDPSGNYLPYAASTIDTNNQVVFQHESDGDLYHLQITNYQDEGVTFPVDIYTPNWTGGTRNWKTLSRLTIVGDQAAASTAQLRFSDDDYQTWTDAGSVDLSIDDPFWEGLGSFKKRAFRLTHNANAPFRVESLEPIVSVGGI